MARRYFLRPDGCVIASTESPSDSEIRRFTGFTEVRVAPLDAVVIDGLPDVVPQSRPGYYDVNGQTFYFAETDTADDIEAAGRGALAIAAYLRAHRPIDEAQVQALANDLAAAGYSGTVADARHLIAQGWTKGGDR